MEKKFPTGRSVVYTKKIMPKKTSTGGPTASGAVISDSAVEPHETGIVVKADEAVKGLIQ